MWKLVKNLKCYLIQLYLRCKLIQIGIYYLLSYVPVTEYQTGYLTFSNGILFHHKNGNLDGFADFKSIWIVLDDVGTLGQPLCYAYLLTYYKCSA